MAKDKIKKNPLEQLQEVSKKLSMSEDHVRILKKHKLNLLKEQDAYFWKAEKDAETIEFLKEQATKALCGHQQEIKTRKALEEKLTLVKDMCVCLQKYNEQLEMDNAFLAAKAGISNHRAVQEYKN